MPFVLDGHGAALDGSAPIPDDGWTHYRDNIFRFRPKWLIRAVLFYRGRSIAPLPLPQTAAYPPRLAAMEWCVIEGAIYFAVEPAKLPPDYKLSYAGIAYRTDALPGPAGHRPQPGNPGVPGRWRVGRRRVRAM